MGTPYHTDSELDWWFALAHWTSGTVTQVSHLHTEACPGKPFMEPSHQAMKKLRAQLLKNERPQGEKPWRLRPSQAFQPSQKSSRLNVAT